MEPFFSIITVCLNAGNDLVETSNSILKQSFSNFEIIIKDGCSNDGSLNQLNNDNRIRVFIENDTGIYNAMNQALEKTKGEYVLFLNAGDLFYDSSILYAFHDTIINNHFPALVYCDYTTTGLGEYVLSPDKLSNFFLFRTMLCHQVCIIKKEFYNSIGHFNENYKVDADYDFLLRLIIQRDARYKHINQLGIISKSKGFSFQNSKLAKKEVRDIRKKYFANKYFFFSLIWMLTLPSIREIIVTKSGYFSKKYQKVVNIFNRLF